MWYLQNSDHDSLIWSVQEDHDEGSRCDYPTIHHQYSTFSKLLFIHINIQLLDECPELLFYPETFIHWCKKKMKLFLDNFIQQHQQDKQLWLKTKENKTGKNKNGNSI